MIENNNNRDTKKLHRGIFSLIAQSLFLYFFSEYVTDEIWERPTDLTTITNKNATTMFMTELIRGLSSFLAVFFLLYMELYVKLLC